MNEQEAARRWRGLPAISRSLQILAAAFLVVVAGLTLHQLLETRASILAESANQMGRLDMVFAEQTGRAVETVDLIQRNMIELLPNHLADSDPHVFDAMIARRIEGVRQVAEIALVDAEGRIRFSSRADDARSLPAAGLMQLAFHRDHPEAGPQISEPLRMADGKWTALMTRRIASADGGFDGVAVSYLNLLYFEDFYKAVDLKEGGAILLHRRDGTVLARYPHNDGIIGLSYAEMPPFRDILSRDIAGTVLMDSPLDGSRRVLAIRALRMFPLAVNVSVDQSIVLAEWRRQTWFFAFASLLGGGAVGALLLKLATRSKQMEGLVRDLRGARDGAEESNRRLVVQMEERERAEAALRQAQRIEAVGQLTGGVAHDFNNLLTVVLGNLDLLQPLVSDPGAVEHLGVIRTAAERGAMLTDQLLAFARRQPLLPQAVEINAVVSGMRDLLQSALGSRVRIVTHLDEQAAPAMVDPTQLELVILNLAINARDAMPDGGVLTIGTGTARLGPPLRPEDPPEGDYVTVSVTDTGMGMTREVMAKAFEPFFTTKAPGTGSGLGLSQVFGVARQSGGSVQIDSAPGIGTVVRLCVPRAAADAVVHCAPAAPAVGAAAGKATLLVVDDDLAVRATTVMLLRKFGYRVIEAAGGTEALQRLRSGEAIDLLLTDVAMPEMSGPDLARQARALRARLPIVFFSGYADPDSIAGDGHLQRLVRKPFRPAELSAQIEAALLDDHALA